MTKSKERIRTGKCCSCGGEKQTRYFIFGLCKECQDYIIKERQRKDHVDFNKWCSKEAIELQRKEKDLKKAMKELKDAQIGINLINLLKQVLK